MSLRLRIDGPPGERFAEVIRALPDGRSWLVSDPHGTVVIARNEGTLLREAILSEGDEGEWDLECLASQGVSEFSLQMLVAAAILSCFGGVVAVWWSGLDGLIGLFAGVVAAGTFPSVVIAAGRLVVDPGRDVAAEAHLERAMRFAIAQVRGAELQ